MTITIYGIKNCDTIKKTLKWLENNNIPHTFHDYKKDGLDEHVFNLAIAQHGWETVINKRGTTWRNLDERIQNSVNDENAYDLAKEQTSIIKRPILKHNENITIGFKEPIYKSILKDAL